MKNEDMKISVIIPVYNVECYLPTCVESTLGQTYPNLEIILVDDGSPDQCPQICDNYARQFQQIKVIHKPNGGLSDARNAGIAASTGTYVLFLDGDDFWDDPDGVSRLVNRIETTKADVLNFSYKKYQESTGEKEPYFKEIAAMPPETRGKRGQLAYLMAHGLYIASACNKLIKRNLAQILQFETGVYSEDIEWCAELMQAAESMDFVCENFYCYRQRAGSISQSINEKKCADLCHHIVACIELAEKAESCEKKALRQYAAYQYGTFFKVQAMAEQEPAACIQTLSKYKRILSCYGKNRKLMCLKLGTTVFGYRRICKIIRLVYRQRR